MTTLPNLPRGRPVGGVRLVGHMKRELRYLAVIKWLNRKDGSGYADILNGEFVDFFYRETNDRTYPMPFGANKCPSLGRTLSAMFNERLLDRRITPIDGLAGMGFPKWVYSYKLRNPREI